MNDDGTRWCALVGPGLLVCCRGRDPCQAAAFERRTLFVMFFGLAGKIVAMCFEKSTCVRFDGSIVL